MKCTFFLMLILLTNKRKLLEYITTCRLHIVVFSCQLNTTICSFTCFESLRRFSLAAIYIYFLNVPPQLRSQFSNLRNSTSTWKLYSTLLKNYMLVSLLAFSVGSSKLSYSCALKFDKNKILYPSLCFGYFSCTISNIHLHDDTLL